MCGVSVLGPAWTKDLTDSKPNFLDPKLTDLNSRLNDLKTYYQPGFMGNYTTDQDAAFAFGQAAMIFYGIWDHQNWINFSPVMRGGYFMVPPISVGD